MRTIHVLKKKVQIRKIFVIKFCGLVIFLYLCTVNAYAVPSVRDVRLGGTLHNGIAFTRLFLDNLKLRYFPNGSRAKQRGCS